MKQLRLIPHRVVKRRSPLISIPFIPMLFGSGVLSTFITIAPSAVAQIVPDSTLIQNSRVELDCTDCFIEGGTTVGTTLFHSFEQFSVPTGGRAFFVNATSISDIISRVTGDSVSTIDGRIDAIGSANLFLINPNGVVFGPNATLSIGGSFLATTADQFDFADAQPFSAINPEPAPTMLTISTPVGLQFGGEPGAIAIQSSNLRGSDNSTLALVGGELDIEAGILRVRPGRIELGSVGANGLVAVSVEENGVALNYDETQQFQDITIAQGSFIGVGDVDTGTLQDQRGDLQLQGRQIKITNSQLNAVTAQGDGSDVTVQASELLAIEGQLPDDLPPEIAEELSDDVVGIFNTIEGTATAENDGMLRIDSPEIILRGGSQIASNNGGSGIGIPLQITSKDILLEGGLDENLDDDSDDPLPSGFFARVKQGAGEMAVGGFVSIESDRLDLQNGAQISSDTNGDGQAGNIDLQVSDQITVEARLATDLRVASGIFAQVDQGANGDGGNITINTPILTVTGGAQISTAARSGGAGGNITINDAQIVLLSGTAKDIERDDNISGILVSAEEGAENDAGSLTLNAEQLIVEDGARISADNRGAGQGGSATLNVQDLIVDRGQILAASFKNNPDEPGLENVPLTSGGNAGELTINARTISLSNEGEISVQAQAKADAGDITITVETLDILNSTISASAQRGRAGSITISTTGSEVFVSGNNAAIAVEATRMGGEAGDLIINTEVLDVSNGATLSVSAPNGTAGNVEIGAATIVLDSGRIEAETQQTPDRESGANIEITGINILLLTNDSLISARALAQADGGNITLDASQGFITAPDNVNSDIIASALEGTGGEINITAQGLFGLQERPQTSITNDIDASSQFGLDGTVAINRIEVDPSRGLIALPSNVVDVSRLIAQQCNAGGYLAQRQSDFVITGQGGLVPAPGDLVGQAIWDDMRSPFFPSQGLSQSHSPSQSRSPTVSRSPHAPPPTPHNPHPPIEAQAWTQTFNGQIRLLAHPSAPLPVKDAQWQVLPTCSVSRG